MNLAEAVYYLRERRGPLLESIKLIENDDDYDRRLSDPIAYGIRALGGSVNDITADGIVDADLAFIADADIDKFLDISEYRVMQNALSAARRLASTSLGPRSVSYSDIANGLESDIAAKRDFLQEEYGFGQASMSGISGGTFSLSFAETFDV